MQNSKRTLNVTAFSESITCRKVSTFNRFRCSPICRNYQGQQEDRRQREWRPHLSGVCMYNALRIRFRKWSSWKFPPHTKNLQMGSTVPWLRKWWRQRICTTPTILISPNGCNVGDGRSCYFQLLFASLSPKKTVCFRPRWIPSSWFASPFPIPHSSIHPLFVPSLPSDLFFFATSFPSSSSVLSRSFLSSPFATSPSHSRWSPVAASTAMAVASTHEVPMHMDM